MTEELRTVLHRVAGDEARRFDAEHAGEETTVYERAIGPRRAARRGLEALGALAAVAAVGVGGYALAVTMTPLEPAWESPPPTPAPTLSPSPPAETTWKIGGLEADRSVSAAPLEDFVGPAVASSASCAALDAIGHLAGSGGIAAWSTTHLGAFAQDDGAVNDVTTGEFDSEAASAAYLDEAEAVASACGDDLAGTGATAAAVSVAFVGTPGETVKLEVASGDADSATWMLWLHAVGTRVISVVVEPGATDLGPAIISDLVQLS